MNTPLVISDLTIRQDVEGRYSFNDLHKAAIAAGNDYKTCQVEHFTRNDSTEALIAELRKNGELEIDPYVSTAGRYGGTWGCKELVYAYAMWISPAFHLKVIRAYDAMATATQQPESPLGVHETQPFQKVNAAVLSGLLKMSKGLAESYLLELGVTPEYIAKLQKSANFAPAGQAATPQALPSNVAPLAYLAEAVPGHAGQEDDKLWYVTREDFAALCAGYDVPATARALADRRLLRYDNKEMTVTAPLGLFDVRIKVYAIRKSLPAVAARSDEVRHGR